MFTDLLKFIPVLLLVFAVQSCNGKKKTDDAPLVQLKNDVLATQIMTCETVDGHYKDDRSPRRSRFEYRQKWEDEKIVCDNVQMNCEFEGEKNQLICTVK